jgi:Arc/MetJ-type ribon-helix-helix transcriptional regulator
MPKKKRIGSYKRVALDFDEEQITFLTEYGQKTYRTQSDVIRYAVSLLMRTGIEENLGKGWERNLEGREE